MSALAPPTGLYWPRPGADAPPTIGGKARGLLQITAAGLPTAPWFAVPATLLPPAGQALAPEVADAVAAACDRLAALGATGFAVRSSALDEDGPAHSFAGQHVTVLNAGDGVAVLAALDRCRASVASEGAIAYRWARGLDAISPGLAVVVQAMVPAEIAGVAFSRAPDGATDDVLVAAVSGLGEPLAHGLLTGDEVAVARDGTVRPRRTGAQTWRLDAVAGGGIARRSLDSDRPHHCLDDQTARRVARLALRLEAWRGAPQDVEWAMTADGDLIVLQTRPITTLGEPQARADVRVWDNANIVESFPGVTTPLTYSVAREAYAAVYRQACRALGVREATIAARADVFEQMIGLIQGRVYYNLNSWHQTLALLPAFRYSQGALEKMMGAARPAGAPAAPVSDWRRRAEVAAISFRLLQRLARLEADARQFERVIARLRDDLRDRDLQTVSADDLLRLFETAQRRALAAWRAPIINDLFLMLFHGALRRAADAWLGEEADALVNAALRGGGLPSTAPAEELRAIAAWLRQEPRLAAVARETPATVLATRVAQEPALASLKRRVDDYLDRWGDRCPEEQKLDRPSYREEPAPLWHALRSLLDSPPAPPGDGDASRRRAEAEIHARLSRRGDPLGPARRQLFFALLRRVRHHLRWREQLRFARSQVFGIARRVFTALGGRLARQGLLDQPEDIHYLHLDEIRGVIRGTAAIGSLPLLVAERRTIFARYRAAPAPPSRFETIGPVELAVPAPVETPGPTTGQDRRWRGVGACAGKLTAPCVVVRDPRLDIEVAGRIVVAESTDPGWAPIMVAAAGLLVERGSLLSHSAIVARELGLPTIVELPGITARLQTGQVVEMDGATGFVTARPDEVAS